MTGREQDGSSDVLMITHNRPRYTELSLQAFLERSDPSMRIFLWRNGWDERTLDAVHRFRSGLYRFTHSVENKGLRQPTNWLATSHAPAGQPKPVDASVSAYEFIMSAHGRSLSTPGDEAGPGSAARNSQKGV